MLVIETSRDVLNLALSISVISLSAFAAWNLFYFAMIMRQGFRVASEVRSVLAKLNQTADALKSKLDQSVSYLGLVGEGLKKIMEMMIESQFGSEEKTERRRTKRK